MVRSIAPRFAVEGGRGSGESAGSVPRAAERDDAAANAGRDGGSVFQPVCRAIPDVQGPGRSSGAGRAAAVAGAWVLLAGAQSSYDREEGCVGIWRIAAIGSGGIVVAAGRGAIHGGGDCVD